MEALAVITTFPFLLLERHALTQAAFWVQTLSLWPSAMYLVVHSLEKKTRKDAWVIPGGTCATAGCFWAQRLSL